MERPLFLPLLSTVLGLATADLYSLFLPDIFLYFFLAATLPFIFIKKRPLFFLFLSLFFFTWGNLSLQPYLERQSAANDIVKFASAEQHAIEGVIDERPTAGDRGSKIYLRSERIYRDGSFAEVSGRLLLYIGERGGDFRTGDRIRFVSRISKPRNFGLPGEFDYVRYLAYRHVYATVFVAGSSDVVLMRRSADYPVQSMIDAVADRVGRFISANAPGEEGYILRALLLGDTGNISQEMKDAYSRTGVNHILSISGFHVGIISLFIFYILLLAARGSEYLMLHVNVRRVLLVLTLPIIIFYLFLSGAAPATVRSVIMISAYMLALLLEREVDPLNSLMLAAMAILLWSPPALFDLSFQFSFLALWGIIIFVPLLMAPFRRMEGTIIHKLLVFLMVSLAATIATLLPVAYNFHNVTFTGLIGNFFVVPIMGYGAVVVGFLALPFVFIYPALAALLIKIAALLVKVTDAVVVRLSTLPTFSLINPGRFDFFCFFALFIVLSFVTRRKLKLVLCGATLLLFVVVKIAGLAGNGAGNGLGITFFSVGQGESTLISFPNGKRMLIDGGGSLREGGMDVGERLLAPAFRRMGFDRIDYVVLTHAHPDHLKGLQYIVENFTVGEFWESGTPSASHDYADLKRTLAAKGIPVRLLAAADDPIMIGDAAIEPLSPRLNHTSADPDQYVDENENSLVFRLSYGDFSVLFTGDIGFETERVLLRRAERLTCTILKVPHHGSRNSTSNAFLQAVSPKAALISAGYGNSFKLPSERTLTLLRQRGIKIYRTDLDGTIEVFKGKGGWTVSTYRGNGHFH